MKKRLISFLIALVALTPIFAIANVAYAQQATLIYPKTEKKVVVEVGSIKAQILLDSGYQLFKEGRPLLGFSVITDYAPSLTLGLNSAATVIPVSSMTTKDGTAITMSLLGSKVYLNIEPGGSNEEIVVCTGISVKTFTGCTRGLAFSGTSESSVLANAKSHNAGSQVIMSNVHYVYNNFVDLDTNQTITGYKSVPTPSSASSTQIANVSYVNSVAYAGSPNAEEGIKGIVDLATQSQMATGASAGASSSLLVLQSKYASSTSSATTTASTLTSYSESNYSGDTTVYLCSVACGGPTMAGEVFTLANDYSLTSAKFYLKKYGAPTGNIVAELFLADSGTLGVDAKPSSITPLATSANIDISTLATSTSALITFTFSNYQLVKNTNYYIGVEYVGGDSSNYLMVGRDLTSPSYNGNIAYYIDNSSWHGYGDAFGDSIFYVLGTADYTTIPITKSTGKLDSSFIDQTANYTWSGTNDHSGTNSFSGVNTFTATTTLSNGFVPTSTPTVAGQIVGLNASSILPAIDGSLLTNTNNSVIGTFDKDTNNSAGATTTITHGLGRTPKTIRFYGLFGNNVSPANQFYGIYNGSYICSYNYPGSTSSIVSPSYAIYIGSGSAYQTATITTINSSQFVLTWAKTGSPTITSSIIWEAE